MADGKDTIAGGVDKSHESPRAACRPIEPSA
jgi:hypothetical protein